MTPRAASIVKRAAIAALVAVGAVGVLHTKAARPLLARISGAGGCPVLAGQTPEKLEEGRVANLKPLAGEGRAAARPALTFVLGKTKRDDIASWADGRKLSCKDDLNGTALRCNDVDSRSVDDGDVPIEDLFFRFDPGGTLVALDAMHRGANGDEAVQLLDAASARLARALGAPTKTSGERTGAYLTGAPFAQTAIEYRFADYAADVSATNFGDRGVVVREQYRAIPN